MINAHKKLFFAWLWFIGLTCFALPFFWWPREVSVRMVVLVVLYVFVLGIVVRESTEGRLFDGKQSKVRGYAGVLVNAVVIFAGVLAYRWFLK